jgi:iron complex outermembrane recepter protein
MTYIPLGGVGLAYFGSRLVCSILHIGFPGQTGGALRHSLLDSVFEPTRCKRYSEREKCMVQEWTPRTLKAVVRTSALLTLLWVSLGWAQTSSNASSDDQRAASSLIVDPTQADVLDMDLEQLSRADVVVPALDTVVSTVSRQESTVGRSPAAVYVITPEMIRRSGALTIPDLLRMVPGVQVAQIDANRWAISIRGFNGRYSDKLLVQIDGRDVYSRVFSGVFWDAEDVVLQDVERIEVIRGPGATVWGSNAVNGVINIITKSAKDTQGLLVVGGSGSEQRGFSTLRYGGQVGDDLYWRAYGKQFERDEGYYPDGAHDDWRQGRGGFRSDWYPSDQDTFTLQGDFYDGDSGNSDIASFDTPPYSRVLNYDTNIFGQNYLGRWTHVIDDESDWVLQTYFDHVGRHGQIVLNDEQRTYDLDFQYRFPLGPCNSVICGAEYQRTNGNFVGTFDISMTPQVRKADLYSCFVQDEMTLVEDQWYLIAGSKFEQNSFSGFEYQPCIRLLNTPTERESLWAAISRAVRTPNRIDQNSVINTLASPFGPTFVQISGDYGVVSEDLLAYELGYRAQPTDDFSWDLALFYNNYKNLIGTASTGAPFFDPGLNATIIPLEFANTFSADTYGAELSSTYQINPDWQLSGSYTLLYMDVHAGADDITQGSSPNNQVYIESSWNLDNDMEFDVIGRYVDNLPALNVPSYLTMDVRIAWRPYKNFEWSVVGRNLLDSPHQEFADPVGGAISTEVQSEVYTMLTWTY